MALLGNIAMYNLGQEKVDNMSGSILEPSNALEHWAGFIQNVWVLF